MFYIDRTLYNDILDKNSDNDMTGYTFIDPLNNDNLNVTIHQQCTKKFHVCRLWNLKLSHMFVHPHALIKV